MGSDPGHRRAADFSGGRPIRPELPDDQRQRLVEIEWRFAVHLAAHVLAPSTLGYGLAEFQGPLSSGQNVARSRDRRSSRTRSSTAIGAGDSAFTPVLTSPPNIRR